MIQQKEHQQKQEENKCIYEKVIHDNQMNDQQRLDRLQQEGMLEGIFIISNSHHEGERNIIL